MPSLVCWIIFYLTAFRELFCKQCPYCNFIGMIVQYTSIMKEEPYLVLQAINSLLGPKEGYSHSSPKHPRTLQVCLASGIVCSLTPFPQYVCSKVSRFRLWSWSVSPRLYLLEKTKKECLWRMVFSFNEGVHLMDLAPSPPRFVSPPKDKP